MKQLNATDSYSIAFNSNSSESGYGFRAAQGLVSRVGLAATRWPGNSHLFDISSRLLRKPSLTLGEFRNTFDN
ncbi:hypothetical protein [Sphingomicrobium flavum]|uniref:hypothetical protein n=1 Tax=Sphingomicrobium flavum TaxID=1229164 RepID=UPI0021AD97CF|nr:hypothetical protein [Sphingomicrobium flavum]